uniref:Uncharacterized protein n=1 Tax=Arundo donax TaxID=35708 RepID=A0A0A9HK40_ARUDO
MLSGITMFVLLYPVLHLLYKLSWTAMASNLFEFDLQWRSFVDHMNAISSAWYFCDSFSSKDTVLGICFPKLI